LVGFQGVEVKLSEPGTQNSELKTLNSKLEPPA
jgi:hypothetical protein